MAATLSRLFTWRTAIAESSLPPTARLVAFGISLYMNEMGESAWPSVRRLVGVTGLSERAVRDGLRKLEVEEYLVTTQRKGASSLYLASTPAGDAPPTSVQGGQEMPGRGAPAAPELVKNKPEEPNPLRERGGQPASLPQPKPHPHRALFEAVLLACGWGTPLTKSAAGRVGKAASELAAVGAEPDDVVAFGVAWAGHYPNATISPQAITNNWADFRSGKMWERSRR